MTSELRYRNPLDRIDGADQEEVPVDSSGQREERPGDNLAKKVIMTALLAIFVLVVSAYCVYSYALNLTFFRFPLVWTSLPRQVDQ